MATAEDLAPVGAEADRNESDGLDVGADIGVSSTRRTLGLVGQYLALTALALVVVGPILLTIIQAMSPPFAYVTSGKPLHPVQVDWKDRTWFTGGASSVVLRSLALVFFFVWMQRVVANVSWRQWRKLLAPHHLLGAFGAPVAFALTMGPVYQSLHAADGASQWWILLAVVLVAATLVPSFLLGAGQSLVSAIVQAGLLALAAVGFATVFVGAEVWTASWESSRLGPAMRQSVIMAVLITAAQVITSITSAYAFVFLEFPFKRILFALFMGTMLLPMEVTLVGNVALIRDLGWINSMQGLVLPLAATALGTFLVRQGFRGIPPEIRDATKLDGYGHIAFLTKFAVPLTRPVIAAFTVIAALSAWNQYLWPRAIIDNDAYSTLQIQLRTIVGSNVADANVSIASALVAAAPVVLLLIAFQKQIIRGLTAGAVK